MKSKVGIIFYCLLTLAYGKVSAQVSILRPDLSVPSKIAPAYFGPNAFPVPDMSDGTCSETLRLELAGDYYLGDYGDRTGDIYARAFVPLFSDRVNLVLWMPVCEFYTTTEQSRAVQRVDGVAPAKGHEWGDVYLSTDIQVLRQTRVWPDLVIRAGMKTASGGSYFYARYYDSPGYFFDVTAAKSLFYSEGLIEELRLALSTGFLCWQTDAGRQNDAVMYGLLLRMKTHHLIVDGCFSGYAGWEKDGDCPMTAKLKVSLRLGKCEPYAMFMNGLNDFPYTQIRLGCSYAF